MPREEHFRKLERMYLSAPINRFYNPSIRISEQWCEIKIRINEKFFHAAGSLHGSVYFKMLDDAAFFAVNSVVEEIFMLTVQFNIHLIRPVTEGELISSGTLTHASREVFRAESELMNADGKLVATGRGTFLKSKHLLSEEIGYK